MKRFYVLCLVALAIATSSFGNPTLNRSIRVPNSAVATRSFGNANMNGFIIVPNIKAPKQIKAFDNKYAFKGVSEKAKSAVYCNDPGEYMWCMLDVNAPMTVNYELFTGAVCDGCHRSTMLCNSFPGYAFGYFHRSAGPPPGNYNICEVASNNWYEEACYVYIYTDMSGYPIWP
jgi:hypothetical protein